ncbi:carbohydrate binding domain-containing protein [Pseudobutyrivibrio xylanivorans]|uniref:Endo-1,3(4)-beta-glucanase n=1 Tax=Pseudobutyrivibrio xylanivorans TaxID=185007 RepID=A0A5P6VTY7_PSEXY|nr:carbohydrate binding domain-containing protein [Pseudobutyrivibrio xylanivorans]QFJ54684.1 endo-1,3(4)-beta-glucanase [Pseudobutyrivibrio xylanivorans]
MKKGKWFNFFAIAMAATVAVTSVPVTGVQAKTKDSIKDKYSDEGYELVWNDEFEGDSLNTSDWNVEQHEPGWVNSELQRYTALDEGNIEVKDGKLYLKPHVEETKVENEDDNEEEEVVEEKVSHIAFDVNVSEDKKDSDTIALQVNFGKIEDSEAGTAAATVKLSNISLKEDGEELLRDTSFSGSDWYCGFNDPGKGSVSYEDGKAIINIENSGDQNWHIQLQQNGLKLEAGHSYSFEMDAVASADRMVEISFLDPDNGYDWYGGSKATIEGSKLSGGSSSSSSSSKREITSGRITTQNKHDFTYGRFEARAKVPTGKGYLPAFWLMATDEGLYGQWPRCGEIDIMEVMGQDTTKSYHTIHYGYNSGNGHKENQGTKEIIENDFADEYHVFRVDWEPGQITWYVDDEKVFSTNDWYTGADEDSQLTYPAPFDQDFYVILNLAVGGSWVGYPNDDVYAKMNDDNYTIDYVRVYQKSEEEYEKEEAKAKRPEKEPVTYREADEEGNYIINGDFSKDIAIDGAEDADKDNWVLHLESDAKDSTYKVKNNKIKITPSAVGSQNHSVQLKQAGIPMYKGWEYELTFDAVADEERAIIVDVEGPDRGWTRYMQDTSVKVGTKKQSYTYTFTMNDKTDPNTALEFNLGKQKSTAAVTISNVKLVHKSGEKIEETNEKEIRSDGNYIYNGGFDQGEGRLGYWEIEDADKEAFSVTNKKNSRMLKVVAPNGTSKSNPLKIGQRELSPISAGQYEISFDAYTEDGEEDGLTVKVAGETYTPALTGTQKHFSKKITVEKSLTRKASNVEFVFTKPGTYYLDNAFLTEAALIKNGSFNAGIAGFSPYIYDSVNANYVIDNMNGNDNTFAITIEDTVADNDDNCWYIQLNQDGVNLEKGKTYKVSFKAKSSIERVIKYSLQEFEGAWTNYSGTGSVEIGPEWKTFEHTFTMENESDPNTRFNITMGSVDGIRIKEKHDVYIDDIVLVEVDEDEPVPEPSKSEDAPKTKPSDSPAVDEPKAKPSDKPVVEESENKTEETKSEQKTETKTEQKSSSNSSQSSSTSSSQSSTSTSAAANTKIADTQVPSTGDVVAAQETIKVANNKSATKTKKTASTASTKSTEQTETETEEEVSGEATEEIVEETQIKEEETPTTTTETEEEVVKVEEETPAESTGFFAAIARFFKAIAEFFANLFR